MGAGGKIGFELVPELRRLIVHVPVVVFVPGREVTFFGAGAFLIGPGAHDHASVGGAVSVYFVIPGLQIQPVTGPLTAQGVLQGFGFQVFAALQAADVAIGPGLLVFQGLAVFAVDHIQPVLLGQTVAVFDHFGYLVVGVHMDQWERHVAEKGFARQPQQDRGVFADGPEHTQFVERGIRFPQDVNAFGLQLVEIIHLLVSHDVQSPFSVCIGMW